MKVLFITTIPSPYRVSFFNELGKLTKLTVLFEKSGSDERDESWSKYRFESFNGIIMKGKAISVNTAFCPSVVKYLKKKWERIVVCDVYTPTGMLAIQYMKLHKIPYCIEGDGGFAKSGKGLKENIKNHFIKGAAGYFSTSDAHDQYYLTYGAKKNRIYRYPFTSIGSMDIIDHVYSIEEKQQLKKKLNIPEKKCVITVGQFIPRKGFDVLLKAARHMSKEIGFYFIGGKPTQEYIELAKDLDNIHFIGFKRKDELKQYYLAADVFVLPTREDIWGLVINEAMACGLPVITTDKCIAGLELVRDGENGFIVPVNSSKATANRIMDCFKGDNLQEFGSNSLIKIKDYTFEKMAERHMEVLSNE